MKLPPTSEGIMHGPYPGLAEGEVRQYIYERIGNEVPDYVVEKLSDDVQSHHQYEQHVNAVLDAIKEGRIEQGLGLFVMSKVLQPWSRNIRGMYYDSYCK